MQSVAGFARGEQIWPSNTHLAFQRTTMYTQYNKVHTIQQSTQLLTDQQCTHNTTRYTQYNKVHTIQQSAHNTTMYTTPQRSTMYTQYNKVHTIQQCTQLLKE